MSSLTTGTEMPFRGIVANSSDSSPQNVAPPTQVSPQCNHAKHSFNTIQLPNQCPIAPSVVPSADFDELVFDPQGFKSLINSIKNEMDNGRLKDPDRRLTVTPKDMRASATGEGRNLITFNIKKMREEEEKSDEDEEMTDKEDAPDPEKEQ
ncbi:hypothetical protein D6C99_09196 [Aureobasidium pullulans]|nr:hypothetical protein D6C99_09196 [Aureobasidium pullulans]